MVKSSRRSRLFAYGFTLACLAVTTLFSWGASLILQIQAPLFPFSLAIVFIAWFGGLEAGLLGTALGAVMLFGVFRGNLFTFLAIQRGVPLLITFCLLGVIPSLVVARAARDYADAKTIKQELQQANERRAVTNRSLEQFAQAAADSLRTPLRAIGV